MKLFVWDFHGVLEKGNEHAVLEITNLALEQHGYSRRMSHQENDHLAGRQWHEYFAHLIPGLPDEEYLKLQSTCHGIGEKSPERILKHIRINDHAEIVLSTIHESKHCQILISNTLPHVLDDFVQMIGIDSYFPKTRRFGIDRHVQNGVTKLDRLNQFLKGNDPFEVIVSVGDSPGDMVLSSQTTAAKGIGYLYSHPGKKHREAPCHYQIHDLRSVLQELSHSLPS